MAGGYPKVGLRTVRQDDLDWLDQLVDDEEAEHGYATFGFRGRGGYARWFATDGCQGVDSGAFVVWADGERVGEVSYRLTKHGPPPANLIYRIGIGLCTAHRGRGIGGPAQRALADRLFATTLAHRVEAETDVTNGPELRALEKAGFTREGVLREAHFRDGSWHDIVLFSRLRTDL